MHVCTQNTNHTNNLQNLHAYYSKARYTHQIELSISEIVLTICTQISNLINTHGTDGLILEIVRTKSVLVSGLHRRSVCMYVCTYARKTQIIHTIYKIYMLITQKQDIHIRLSCRQRLHLQFAPNFISNQKSVLVSGLHRRSVCMYVCTYARKTQIIHTIYKIYMLITQEQDIHIRLSCRFQRLHLQFAPNFISNQLW